MGAVQKHYCDACGAEVSAVQYGADLYEQSGVRATTLSMDLCGKCYVALKDWLGGKREDAAVSWQPSEPEPIKVDPVADDPLREA